MPTKPQRGYNTNLASEFYVLSMLYRLGLDASLTLGNKKSVDIAVILGPGRAITVDVKAVAGKMDWLVGNIAGTSKPNHYVVLVSFEAQFDNPNHAPRCWIVRYDDLIPLIKTSASKSKLRYLPRKAVLTSLAHREGDWNHLVE